MPISQFSPVIQKIICLLPGTYGSSLLHLHLMRGVYSELGKILPAEVIGSLKEAFDAEMNVFGYAPSEGVMIAVLTGSVTILIVAYVLLCRKKKKG